MASAPSAFVRILTNILRPLLYKCVLIYLDDILIFSRNVADHLRDVAAIFDLLRKAGLQVKLSKCEFGKDSVPYLDHVVTVTGIRPNPNTVKAVVKLIAQNKDLDGEVLVSNVALLRTLLGKLGYYRKFIRNFSHIAHPLTRLTKLDVPWECGAEHRDALDKLLKRLIEKPILAYAMTNKPFKVFTDAYNYGIVAVLAQDQSGKGKTGEWEVVIAYASRHLSESEIKYSTVEKEALAIVYALDTFHC